MIQKNKIYAKHKKGEKMQKILLSLLAILIITVGCNATEEETKETKVNEETKVEEENKVNEENQVEEKDIFPNENEYAAGNSITFEWEAAENATNYQLRVVKRSDATVFFQQILDNTTGSFTVDNFANDGEEYCWQISKFTSEGVGDWSEQTCFINGEL